jgi:hypothetical protein
VFEYYEKVLGAVYSRPLELKRTKDVMGEILPEVLSLVTIAEDLGCVHVIERPLDSQLMEFGHDLWIAIMRNSIEWAELAVRVRSFSIAKEALIHMIGLWHTYSEDDISGLSSRLRTLCESKHKALLDKQEETEQWLASYTPTHLQHNFNITATVNDIGRNVYGAEVFDWMALALWRTWYSFALLRSKHSAGPDGGMTLYNNVLSMSTVGRDELAEFHHVHQMTSRGMHRFADRVDELKSALTRIVKPLMKSNLTLDLSRAEERPNYLLCSEFNKDDITWLWKYEENGQQTLDWQAPTMSLVAPAPRTLPEMLEKTTYEKRPKDRVVTTKRGLEEDGEEAVDSSHNSSKVRFDHVSSDQN